MSDRYDAFVQRVIDATTNNFGSMSVYDLERIIQIVSPRDTRPRRLCETLRRLGHQVSGLTIVGISPRTAESYLRFSFGESTDAEDILRSLRPGFERTYARYLFGGNETLHGYTFQ